MKAQDVEARVHMWYLANESKTHDDRGQWWNIKNEFLQTALKTMGMTESDYQDFFQRKSEEFNLVSTGAAE